MLILVIPTFNAEPCLETLLPQIAGERIVVSDGGSTDRTLYHAVQAGAVIAVGASGRGAQLALGAKLAQLSGGEGDWFLFLHADSHLPDGWKDAVTKAMDRGDPAYFRFRANASGAKARFMDAMVALRCRALGLPYGDQGLLISRALYEAVGGYAAMPLFEDVDMIERVRRAARLRALPLPIRTDISKHDRDGLWRRGLRNLRLLWRYKRGATTDELVRGYGA